MLWVYCDFNDATPDEEYFILFHNRQPLDDCAQGLGLAIGDKVILYQDDDDFEVLGTLNFKYIALALRECWVAVPDWSTVIRK